MPTAHEDAIDSLLGQHQQIKLLFAQVAAASGEHRDAQFAELVALLAVHESIELTFVHPLAQGSIADGDQVVQARLTEEQDARAALSRLYELDSQSPDFALELAALRDAVTIHAESEEELEFLQLRKVTDTQSLNRLVAVTAAAPALAAQLPTGPPDDVFQRAQAVLDQVTNPEVVS